MYVKEERSKIELAAEHKMSVHIVEYELVWLLSLMAQHTRRVQKNSKLFIVAGSGLSNNSSVTTTSIH